MKLKRYICILAAAILALPVCVSCKDDDDDDEYLSFRGSLLFSVPSYVAPGDAYTMTPGGLSRAAEDKSADGIGYYWSIDPIAPGKDTTRYENTSPEVLGSKFFTVRDTLCTYTIACTAFARGYTAVTTYAYPTVVLGGDDKTLTGMGYDKSYDFTDARDGKTYHATRIGSKLWMSQNLAYAGSGEPFADCVAMEDVFGHYYTWNEAVSACPEGWSLPSNSDWQDMASVLTGRTFPADSVYTGVAGSMMVDGLFNGEPMWEYWPSNKITAESGFCAIPSGYAYRKSAKWYYSGSFYYAAYWCTDEADAIKAYYRYIFAERPEFQVALAEKDGFSAPVRCVKSL